MTAAEGSPPEGHCAPGWEGVRDRLAESLDAGDDLGASVCAMVDGEAVVDVWGGYQDRAKTLPWTRDTICCVYSSGKAVLSALVLRAVSEGALDYDAPVSRTWPDFAAHGKDVTLAQAMSHQSGVVGFAEEVDPAIWLDWDRCCAALADEAPLWPPGTASGYGPQSFGYVVGEVLRRATGRTYGQHLRALRLGIHCGLSLSEATRAAPMAKPPRAPDLGVIDAPTRAAFLQPWSSPSGVSRKDWAAAEIPASNTHATARGLAEVMQGYAAGRVAGAAWAEEAAREAGWAERIAGPDKVLPFELSWCAGLMRETREGAFGGSPTAIGHYGFGGSCVMADPATGLSFAYVPNKMSSVLVGDPRARALLLAVRAAL